MKDEGNVMNLKKIMAVTATAGLAVLLLSSCSSSASSDSSSPSPSSTIADSDLVLDESYQNLIIDIRSPEQYAVSHVEGAVNVPFEEINLFNNVLVTLGKGKFYVIYGDEKASADEALKSFKQIALDAAAYDTMQDASDETALPIVK